MQVQLLAKSREAAASQHFDTDTQTPIVAWWPNYSKKQASPTTYEEAKHQGDESRNVQAPIHISIVVLFPQVALCMALLQVDRGEY